MAVYVDTLIDYPNGKGFWKNKKSCHMFADTNKELQSMAMLLGLKRSWFQNKSILAHYDLTESRRKQAIKLGAVEVPLRFVGEYMRSIRIGSRPMTFYQWKDKKKLSNDSV